MIEVEKLSNEELATLILGAAGNVDALTEAARRLRASTWKPIAEAPRDGTMVLALYRGLCQPMRWDHNFSCWEHVGILSTESPGGEPTHFMPLPPAPAPESEAGND